MPIRNYTSKQNPATTAGEIQRLLAENGAGRISIDYQNGQASAVEFMMEIAGRMMLFRIEPDPTGMLAAMKKDKGVQPRFATPEQAARTAWKNKYDWLDAQLAEVAAGQARLDQLLLGFIVMEDGEPLYQKVAREGHFLPPSNVKRLQSANK